jgi:hypothetical protein
MGVIDTHIRLRAFVFISIPFSGRNTILAYCGFQRVSVVPVWLHKPGAAETR